MAVALLAVVASVGLITAGCGGQARPVAVPTQGTTSSLAALPRPQHVVVVIMENQNLDQVVGNPDAPTSTSSPATGPCSPTTRRSPTPASRTTWRCSPGTPRE